jgi:hypothetical protein
MNEVTLKPERLPEAGEAQTLARELAAAYRDRVYRHKFELGLSTEEAVAMADEPTSLSETFRIMDRPAQELTWHDLQMLVGKTGERSTARWEEVKEAAREELRSGERAGMVLLGRDSRPIDLARFLAIREELADGYQPLNGIERQLIDQLAQAQAAMNVWLERLSLHDPFVDPEAADKVAAMVERFGRMFARQLRSLCELRKAPLAVVVQNTGQVNVGQQQVNVAPQAAGRNGGARPRGEGRRRARPGACTSLADRRALIGGEGGVSPPAARRC